MTLVLGVVTVLCVVIGLAAAALFWRAPELQKRVLGLFSRPLGRTRTAGARHYYKPYWDR